MDRSQHLLIPTLTPMRCNLCDRMLSYEAAMVSSLKIMYFKQCVFLWESTI